MFNPIQQYLDSLSRLKELEVDLVLPGHGQVFTGHRKRIEEMFEHYQQKSLIVLDTYKKEQKALTAYQIACVLPWTPGSRTVSWEKLGSWDKRFAMLQTIALLEQLAFSGKLGKLNIDGINLYKLENLG